MEFIEEDSEYSDDQEAPKDQGVVGSIQKVITTDDLTFNLSKKGAKKSKRQVGFEEVQRAIENDRFVTLVVKRENSERKRIRKKSASQIEILGKKIREQSVSEELKTVITTQEAPKAAQKTVNWLDPQPSHTPEPQLLAKSPVVSFSQSPILTHIPMGASKLPPVLKKPRTRKLQVSHQSIFSTFEGADSSPEPGFSMRTHNEEMRPQENVSKSLNSSTSRSPKRRTIFPSTVNPILRHLGAGGMGSFKEDRDEYYTEPVMTSSIGLRRRVVKACSTIKEELSAPAPHTHLSKKYVAAHIAYDRDLVSKGFSPFRCSKREIFNLRVSPVPSIQKKNQKSIVNEALFQGGKRKKLSLPLYGF